MPNDAEWTQLVEYLGGEKTAGAKLKSTQCWQENGNGDNSSQFSGLPGGTCADDGYLGSIGYLGVWWSTSEDACSCNNSTAQAWDRYLYFAKNDVVRYAPSKGNGFSVRCLKD